MNALFIRIDVVVYCRCRSIHVGQKVLSWLEIWIINQLLLGLVIRTLMSLTIQRISRRKSIGCSNVFAKSWASIPAIGCCEHHESSNFWVSSLLIINN